MKKKPLYFLILTFFVSNILSAQQPQLVLPSPDDVGQSVSQSPSTNRPSGNFELLDLTGDSLVLGYLPLKEGCNERQVIVTPGDKSDTAPINSFVINRYELTYLPGGQPLSSMQVLNIPLLRYFSWINLW